MRVAATVGILLLTILAGCADDAEPELEENEIVNTDEFTLDAALGAIDGLLVDDRFRPIDLESDGNGLGEFQAVGFVLLQETGEQRLTNENGEFQFLDLEPGTYTIRVQSDRHEVTPVKVEVRAGEFTEQNVVGRRVATDVETILTREYGVFIPCAAYATFECPLDFSGETFRAGFTFNYEEYKDDISYLVIEAYTNQGGIYCTELRIGGAAGTSGEEHYMNECTEQGGRYMKGILQPGENYMQDGEDPWKPEVDQEVLLFYFGNNELTCWSTITGSEVKRCAGVGAGIKAQFLLSAFLGEPSTSVENYAVLKPS